MLTRLLHETGSVSATPQRPATGQARPGLLLLSFLFVLLVVAVYADPLFFRRNFAGRDILGYNLPVEKSIHAAYRRGRLPVWLSEVSGGRPLLPNPNAGALYPARPALALLPLPLAVRLYPLLHWALAGSGVLLLLSVIGASPWAAWTGAVIYVFSGVSVSEVFYSNYQPGMTLLPWVLWAFHRPAATAAGRILPLSLFFGLLFLAGDVFTSSLALLCTLLWLVLEREKAEQKRLVAALGIALLLAALLALPQIVATALWIPHTNRAVLGMKLREAFLYSVSPYRLLELAIPFPFGPTWQLDPLRVWGWKVFQLKSVGFFSSLYAGSFAAVALVAAWRSRLPGARFARSLFLIGVALSVLPGFVPASWGGLPSLVPLRFPEKFAVGIVLALSVFGARLFDRLQGSGRPPRWPLAAGSLLALLAAFSALAPEAAGRLATRLTGAEASLSRVAAEELSPALAEAGLLWMATVVALGLLARGKRWPFRVAVLLLTAIPILADRRIARTFRQEEVFAQTAFDRFQKRSDPDGLYRALGESIYSDPSGVETRHLSSDPGQLEFSRRNWDQYTHVLWDRGTVFNLDFDVGDLSRLESLRRLSALAAASSDSSPFFGALALKWGIRFHDQKALPGYAPFAGSALQIWDRHERAFPAIRLAQRWREETGALAAAAILPRLAPGEMVLETGSRRTGQASAGSVLVQEATPERVRLLTRASERSWLFVLRGYWPYRSVRVDGREEEVVPAQIAFSAVAVPPGRHTIEWAERVPGLSFSGWGPLLFLAGCAALLLRRPRYRTA
jgi:hypothetical protein